MAGSMFQRAGWPGPGNQPGIGGAQAGRGIRQNG
jgi:hypothetical protein